jgi:hypothetical protein
LDVLHKHVVAAFAVFFLEQLLAMVDDSVGGFSDERGPQELNKWRLKENSSFFFIVLAEDIMTALPPV